MIKEWGGPFAIKGIMTGEDAKRAADIGATRGHGQQPRRPAARFLAGAVRRAQRDRRRRRRPPRGDSRRRRAPRHAHSQGARARRARVLGGPAASLRPRRGRRSRRRPGAEDPEDRARARHGAARLSRSFATSIRASFAEWVRRGRPRRRRPAASRRGALDVRRFRGGELGLADDPDLVATEEPFEIRLGYSRRDGSRAEEPVSVTMRTPGHDEDLAVGFLFTEGIIRARSDVQACRGARAARGRRLDQRRARRADVPASRSTSSASSGIST